MLHFSPRTLCLHAVSFDFIASLPDVAQRTRPHRYFTTDWAGNPLPAALGQQVVHSAKPPLFFQHQGHSRTVVGVERRRLRWDSEEETLLLILDPSSRTGELVGKLRSGAGWQGLVKRGLQTLRGREYQIVAVQQGIAKEGEREVRRNPLAPAACGFLARRLRLTWQRRDHNI